MHPDKVPSTKRDEDVDRAFHEFVGLAACAGIHLRDPHAADLWQPLHTDDTKWEVAVKFTVAQFESLRPRLSAQGWQFPVAEGPLPNWFVRYTPNGRELVVSIENA